MLGHPKLGDPARWFWQPWISHWFPAIGPNDMDDLSLHEYIAMHRFTKKD